MCATSYLIYVESISKHIWCLMFVQAFKQKIYYIIIMIAYVIHLHKYLLHTIYSYISTGMEPGKNLGGQKFLKLRINWYWFLELTTYEFQSKNLMLEVWSSMIQSRLICLYFSFNFTWLVADAWPLSLFLSFSVFKSIVQNSCWNFCLEV